MLFQRKVVLHLLRLKMFDHGAMMLLRKAKFQKMSRFLRIKRKRKTPCWNEPSKVCVVKILLLLSPSYLPSYTPTYPFLPLMIS